MVKQQTQEQPQKSREQDMLQKHPQIDQLINFASYGMHAMNFCASLEIFMHQRHRMQS